MQTAPSPAHRVGGHRLLALALAIAVVMTAAVVSVPPAAAGPDAIHSCGGTELFRNDDGSSDEIGLPFTIDFLGVRASSLWVNNNGNVTFDGPMRTYTPFGLVGADRPIIAPFFADVDTRPADGGTVTYGTSTYQGRTAFCVTWDQVGYYNQRTDLRNTFQLLIVDRSDEGPRDFDIVFNYESVEWETGEASSGIDGRGGASARLGYANGTGTVDASFEWGGSGRTGALLDGADTALRDARRGSAVPGRLVFEIRSGAEERSGGGLDDGRFVYAALGDSFSSGVGTDGLRTDEAIDPCYRTVHSFGYRLFDEHLGADGELISAACGGARIRHVLRDAQHTPESHALDPSPSEPQIAHLGPEVDLITITVGGNDVGFSAVLAYCFATSDCQRKFTEAAGGVDPLIANIDALYSSLFETYQTLRRVAPNASIHVVGYPNLFSEREYVCLAYDFFSDGELDYLHGLNVRLNRVVAEAAADAGVFFVDVAGSDAGARDRGVCGRDEHINTPIQANFDDHFHPNRAGHAAYLDLLLDEGVLDLAPNPAPLLRRGDDPSPTRTFQIGFVTDGTSSDPSEGELIADFDPIAGASCRWWSRDCEFGVRVRNSSGERWSATVYSDPLVIGSGTVGEDGSFVVDASGVQLPPGSHTLVIEVTGPSSTEILVYPFVVEDPSVGYWMVDASGQVYSFGEAAEAVAVPGVAVATASTPTGAGLWVLTDDGVVHTRDGAAHFGDVDPAGLLPGETPSTLSVLPGGDGYWVFTTLGRALSFGSAPDLEDLVELGIGPILNGPVLASVATPTGQGAYMIGSDGGVFAVGDAIFRGSTGDLVLNEPVVGVAPDPDGSGYWLVAADGGVFAFDAAFRGSVPGVLEPGVRLNAPVVGAVAFGGGYLLVASDGGIFNFSDEPFLGSLGDQPPTSPVTAVAGFPR